MHIIIEIAQIGAVSHFNIRLPSVAAFASEAMAALNSSSSNPPSLPITTAMEFSAPFIIAGR